MLFST